ncbi:hypothetical protein ACI65C_013612 [Semiaphis heraclei]
MLIPMGLCLFTAVVYNILQCYFPILLLKSYHQIIAVVQKKGDIIIVENIRYSTELNCYVIVGRTFLNKNDFFKKPCKSSSLGIFEVQKQSVLKCWPITEIITKMWILIHLIDDGEKVPDVIQNTWKINQSSCWYPKNLKSNVINSLARKQIMPSVARWYDLGGEYCCMVIVIRQLCAIYLKAQLFFLTVIM